MNRVLVVLSVVSIASCSLEGRIKKDYPEGYAKAVVSYANCKAISLSNAIDLTLCTTMAKMYEAPYKKVVPILVAEWADWEKYFEAEASRPTTDSITAMNMRAEIGRFDKAAEKHLFPVAIEILTPKAKAGDAYAKRMVVALESATGSSSSRDSLREAHTQAALAE